MAKGLQILTANRLTDGAVVYWRDAGWENTLAKAEIIEDEAKAKAALEAAKAWVADRVVVNPYLFEAAIDEGVLVPVKEREAIRAAGPTVRRDLGKQAQQKPETRNQKSDPLRAPKGKEMNLKGEGI